MFVTTIGTGTSAPHPARVQSGTLVVTANARVLVDCGSGVVWRMAALGVAWQDITHVLLTHFHADHTSDLATLFFAWRWGQLPPRTVPITVVGPSGTDDLLRRHAAALGESMLQESAPLTVIEIAPDGTVELADGCTVHARKTPHTDESVAYAITSPEARIVISGDTGFDQGVGEWARGTDLFLCECSLPHALAIPTHLTPRECGRLAALAGPKLMALTHFYPPVERVDIEAEVREAFDGPLALTHDGWTWQPRPE